jgi:hypothetical protein
MFTHSIINEESKKFLPNYSNNKFAGHIYKKLSNESLEKYNQKHYQNMTKTNKVHLS